jgi:cytosine deaminase
MMPAVKPLRAHGVTVFGGNDNIRDLWSPYGTGDMLERAWMIAQRQGFRADEDLAVAFDVCTAAGAGMLGLDARGIVVGATASFVALGAETLSEAIAERPRARQVWIAGVKQ